MRPVVVEVLFELAECCCRVPLIDKEDAVEEFAADGADEAFGDGVGPWCSYRRWDDLNIGGCEDRVERGGELGVAIADEEPESLPGVVEVHGEVARQLGQPRASRVRGDAEDVDAAGGVLDDEERVQPMQADGVEVKQIAGQDPLGLGSKEVGPGGSGAAGRWVDAGAVQDLPDGGGADVVAEAGEFAVDASVSPRGVLGGQADRKSSQACGEGGSTRSPWLRPAAGDEALVPAQDRRGRDEHPEPSTSGEEPGQGGHYGSVGPADPRSGSASVKHCELMAEDEDLDLFGRVGSRA